MIDLLKYIVEQLVDDKSAVNIETVSVENSIETILIKVADNDVGKVIGKQGRIAMALRTLAKSVGMRDGKKYVIDIAD